MSTRRGFMAFTASAVAAGFAPPIGAANAVAVKLPSIRKPASDHPDAVLIRLCAQHVVNMDAYNHDAGDLDAEDCPLWLAYASTRDAISTARPQTMDGFLAKARAAKAEARTPGGEENPENCPAARWAWDLVNDLLAGSVGA